MRAHRVYIYIVASHEFIFFDVCVYLYVNISMKRGKARFFGRRVARAWRGPIETRAQR